MIIFIIGLITGGFIGFVYKEEINNLIGSVKNILSPSKSVRRRSSTITFGAMTRKLRENGELAS